MHNSPSDQRAETAAAMVMDSRWRSRRTAPARKVSSLDLGLILALLSRNGHQIFPVDPCRRITYCKTQITLHRWLAVYSPGG
jgi:hypothetical protein